MTGDAIGAIVLAIVAALLLIWGIRKALREDSVPPQSPRQPLDPFHGMTERERRYHSSDQFGR